MRANRRERESLPDNGCAEFFFFSLRRPGSRPRLHFFVLALRGFHGTERKIVLRSAIFLKISLRGARLAPLSCARRFLKGKKVFRAPRIFFIMFSSYDDFLKEKLLF